MKIIPLAALRLKLELKLVPAPTRVVVPILAPAVSQTDSAPLL